MTSIMPASMWPNVSVSSVSLRGRRNQSTSIGAPKSSLFRPAFSRIVEWRPSAPTTRSARIVERAVRRVRTSPDDAAALLDQISRLRLHPQIEARVAPAVRGEKIEKIPLRHQRDELAVGRHVGQIDELHAFVADLTAQPLDLLVRQLEELVEQPELVHQLQRRGMDGVAAKVAQEIRVLLEHDDIDAGAREQEAEHHPGRSAAGDAASGADR